MSFCSVVCVWVAGIVETTTSRGGMNATDVKHPSQKAWEMAAWTEVGLASFVDCFN